MLLNPLNRKVREHQGFPVLPGAFPLVGHLPAIMCNLPDLLRQAEREIGTHFWLDFGFTGMELTCLLPDTAPILKNKVTTSMALEKLAPEVLTDVAMAQDGEIHRAIRAGMNGPFQPSGLNATGLAPIFAGMIERKVQAWQAEGEIALMPEARDLILALIFRLLGIEEAEFSVWSKNFQRFTTLMIAPPIDLPGMPRPRGRRARDWIDERLRGFIREARARPDAEGLLAAVVRSFDSSGGLLTESHLIANLRFLILAGHESTAATIAWVLVELAQRPAIWDALCDEANAVGAVPRSPQELASFPYAEALFRETLRCHPAIPLSKRRALVDFELGGKTVPAEANLCVPLIHWSGHPDLHERPGEFMLERWLGRKESVKPIETLQFGGGPHFCLGYHLAWLEIVQFSVALALTMSARKRRPTLLRQRPSGQRYYPVSHPPVATRVAFV